MNLIQSNVKTMSSREIAELTGKQLSHVHRDFKKMMSDLGINNGGLMPNPNMDQGFTYDMDGQNRISAINLDQELTLTLVSGYSAKLRNSIINRWQELEQAAKPMSQLEMIAGMAGAMVEVERKQVEQAKALEDITSKVARLETSDKVLTSCPVNAEGITAICARMNFKYSIPAWAVKEIVRGSYGIRPAGNVQNQHESAKGSTYVVWWVSDITALFKRISKESVRVTPTMVTHNTVSKRFKLISEGVV